jgi:predicted PurR-regulated permease PerM
MLPENPIARWLLVLVLLAGVYFFKGFLVPVLAALVIGFASWPLYRPLVRACGGRTTLAATIALLLVILVVVIPVGFMVSYSISEIRVWVSWLLEANKVGLAHPEWLGTVPFVGPSLVEQWNLYLGKPNALNEFVQLLSGEQIGNISRWVFAAGNYTFNMLLNVLFILITLFFLYKDGTRLAAQIDRVGERILPKRWNRFSRVVPATVSSTVTGMTIIAVGEGIVLGVAYKLAGVESAFLLGVLTGFMAMIPGGAPLAFTSVSLYLVGSGNPVAGVALFVWGSVELFIVDKTLRPKLVGGPIRLPFLPTFFGLIGGVKTMGLVGLFVGPVLMALLFAIWREWIATITDDEAAEADGNPS